MDEQGRFALPCVTLVQVHQFGAQLFDQADRGTLFAHLKAYAVTPIDALRERTEPEPDDRFFQPAARGLYDDLIIDEFNSCADIHSVMRTSSSILIPI